MSIDDPLRCAFERELERAWPLDNWCKTRILVAVSGGADSVALLYALCRLTPHRHMIDAAHFNHGWRGTESDGDQQFVEELCAQLGVRLVVNGISTSPTFPVVVKTEAAARDARYAFLTRTAYQTGARYVVTGHTASDRVETLLHNLFRGTGLAGASTPSRTRALDQDLVLVRPLLNASRSDVVAYLEQLGQPFRLDSSNDDQSFRRNFIRKTLLPMIRQEYGAHVDEKLLSFSEIAEQALVLQQQLADDYLAEAAELACQAVAAGELASLGRRMFALPNSTRLVASWTVVRQALHSVWTRQAWPLQKMTRTHWEQIREIWEKSEPVSGRSTITQLPTVAWQKPIVQNLPNNLQLCCMEDWLVIREAESSPL